MSVGAPEDDVFRSTFEGRPAYVLTWWEFPAQRQAGNTYTFAYFYFCKNKTGYPLSKTNIMISYNSSLRLIPLMSTTGHSGKEGNANTESAEGRASELEKGAKHVVCESESM